MVKKDIQNILFVFNLVKRRVPWLYPVGEESSYQICERAPAASFPKGAPASLMDYPTSYSPTQPTKIHCESHLINGNAECLL